MKIELGKNLNSTNLYKLIEVHWNKSFNSKIAIFDLSQLEWISLAEATFLMGWIKALRYKEIFVSIQLQQVNDLLTGSKEYERRKYCLERLYQDLNFIKILPSEVALTDGGIQNRKTSKQTLSEIVPIHLIKYNTQTFDHDFDKIYEKECSYLKRSFEKLFQETNLNYYDTNFLNYSLIKELYSNACIHSASEVFNTCLFSIGLNKKFRSGEYEKYLSDQRILELTPLEKHYYTTDSKYRNLDFIEINFQDFGKGIPETLRAKYMAENDATLESFFGDEYELHKMQNEDTRILHYALLLFTSQFEIDRKFEIHDFIPRGLYIVQEIVEKYNGYFEILSYRGGLGISYKNDVKRISFVRPTNSKILFPGTKVKIALPSKETSLPSKKRESLNLATNKQNSFNKIDSIHFLSLYSLVENEVLAKNNKKNESELAMSILSGFFQTLLTQLRNLEKKQIVLVDFAGVDKNTIDLFNKFIYFVSHSPISASHRIILYNLLLKGLNSTIIFSEKTTLKSKGFKPYLVPAIAYDLSVEWLGIKDSNISSKLTKLWQGDTRFEHIPDNLIEYAGNLLTVNQSGKLYSININLPEFDNIARIIEEKSENIIQNEINNIGIRFSILANDNKDYNDVLIEKANTCFLNSNGTFQFKYLSFNEKLYVRSYRKMIATYIMFKSFFSGEIDVYQINKILSVTLSSQILGNEVKEIIQECLGKEVSLIALSNYYNFHNEEGFNDIVKADNVLVVNDVISTGSLTENIFLSIEKRNANPKGCVTIIDMRELSAKKLDYPILSVAKATVTRFENKPDGVRIEWINPVLNAPVTMPQSKSNAITLLTKTEFLEFVREDYIIIGNMKNNSNYLNYYLDTEKLLNDDFKSDFKLINILLHKLKQRKAHARNTEISELLKGVDMISLNLESENKKKILKKVKEHLQKFNTTSLFNEYKVDIVFYPFLSHIGLVEENMMPFTDTSLNDNFPLVFPIPRIMTPKGWRFSFPPKFMNILSESKELAALIIDDGTITGATIMQMIDSVAFLSLKSIDVLSIFGRLEDFQKELFSRVKSIRVKNRVVPLNIYFGVHFSLPIYDGNESPFAFEHREVEQLERVFKLNHFEPEDSFEDFMLGLKTILSNIEHPNKVKRKYPLHDVVVKKDMLDFRDKIGMFDSYRFYSEDVPADGNFDLFLENDVSLLTLISVLNVEPNLYQTLKRIFPSEKIQFLRKRVLDMMEVKEYIDTEEKQYFFIKALFYIDTRKFIISEELIQLSLTIFRLDYCSNSFRYVSYLLLLIGLRIRVINDAMIYNSFLSNMISFAVDLKETNQLIHSKFRFFFEANRILTVKQGIVTDENLPANKYYKLSEYYSKVINNEKSHDEKLLPNHFNKIGQAIQQLLYSISSGSMEDEQNDLKYFYDTINLLRQQYNDEYVEYQFIKDIIIDLKNHSNNDLGFNPSLLYNFIINFEISLGIRTPNIDSLNKINTDIKNYQENLLLSDAKFVRFILNQKSQIESVWNNCEREHLKRKTYRKIQKNSSLDYIIKVNPYILKLTFENLISNKIKYAQDAKWEIFVKENSDSLDLYIKQYSSFSKEKGDGTGQQSIKSILYNFGTLYKKIEDNPYTIKIIFAK